MYNSPSCPLLFSPPLLSSPLLSFYFPLPSSPLLSSHLLSPPLPSPPLLSSPLIFSLDSCKLLVETDSLPHFSPSLLSHCALVHCDSSVMTSDAIVDTWLDRAPVQHNLSAMRSAICLPALYHCNCQSDCQFTCLPINLSTCLSMFTYLVVCLLVQLPFG